MHYFNPNFTNIKLGSIKPSYYKRVLKMNTFSFMDEYKFPLKIF